MSEVDIIPEAVEWPDEIWAEDRQDSHYGLYRLSVFGTVNEPLEHAKYVHHGLYDSLQKYHDTMVANLRAKIPALSTALTQSRAETAAAYEAAAQHIESCSEGPWAKFGFQMAREIRALAAAKKGSQ